MRYAISWLHPRPPHSKTYDINRPDAEHHLLRWHEDELHMSALSETELLPIRTRIHREEFGDDSQFYYDMTLAQAHAYYEEIPAIPAKAAELKAPFDHYFLIHPLTLEQCDRLSERVLDSVLAWIGATKTLYIGEHSQVKEFLTVRTETAQNIRTELWARRMQKAEEMEGYTGSWEILERLSEVAVEVNRLDAEDEFADFKGKEGKEGQNNTTQK